MFARTPRLLLRPSWIEDTQAIIDAADDVSILRNLHCSLPIDSAEDLARLHTTTPKCPFTPLLAFSRTRGAPKLVGGCAIIEQNESRSEMLVWITRDYWGLGFATEAAQATINIARASGLRHLYASHFSDNPAAMNVLTKLGFQPTCTAGHQPTYSGRELSVYKMHTKVLPNRRESVLSAELYRDAAANMAA